MTPHTLTLTPSLFARLDALGFAVGDLAVWLVERAERVAEVEKERDDARAEVARLRAVMVERAEDNTDEPPLIRRNCWTCEHNNGPYNVCAIINGRSDRDDVEAWVDGQEISRYDAAVPNMPPRNADGCPGWKLNSDAPRTIEPHPCPGGVL